MTLQAGAGTGSSSEARHKVSAVVCACWGQDDLVLERRWGLNGMHYSRTLEAWLARQDAQRADVLPLMEVSTW